MRKGLAREVAKGLGMGVVIAFSFYVSAHFVSRSVGTEDVVEYINYELNDGTRVMKKKGGDYSSPVLRVGSADTFHVRRELSWYKDNDGDGLVDTLWQEFPNQFGDGSHWDMAYRDRDFYKCKKEFLAADVDLFIQRDRFQSLMDKK